VKIKKYRATNVKDGLAQVRKELGPDALIIESKKIRQGGLRGLFLPKKVEITAALDSVESAQEKEVFHVIAENTRVEEELDQLKHMVGKLLGRQEKMINGESPYFREWLQKLVDNDVDSELAGEILLDLQRMTGGKDISPDVLSILVSSKVKDMLETAEIPQDTKYISFVGPTGVGKTTTLAKLAAHYSFDRQKKVGIITVDTYRIGAVEQLKTYAAITGIPVEVVFSREDMQSAIRKFAHKEIVLVDTAGRSVKNTMKISETASYLNLLPAGATFLVVSATTKSRDLKRIAQGFKRLNYNYIVFTKLDETETCGSLLNMCYFTSLPLVYITTGQDVPEDIEAADAGMLGNMILGVS
jgi:flagellar biosynthesis protein FlhF